MAPAPRDPAGEDEAQVRAAHAALDAALQGEALWRDARCAAALLAVDSAGLGGAALHALAGPVRKAWLSLLRGARGEGAAAGPWRRMPLHIGDDRLLGGLDLAATLQSGRPVAQRGLLAECDGGVLVAAMAERLEPGVAARIAAVLDHRRVSTEREGLSLQAPARFGLVALDESQADDDGLAPTLRERLAFHLDLTPLSLRDLGDDAPHGDEAVEISPAAARASLAEAMGLPVLDVAAARERLPRVQCGHDTVQALCAAAQALGVDSVRASMHAVRAACVSAALHGRDAVAAEDAACAARLVLAPRATVLPAPPEAADAPPPEPPPPPPAPPEDSTQPPDPPNDPPPADPDPPQPLEDVVLAAAQAALPAALLAMLLRGDAPGSTKASGRGGLMQAGQRRGRPAGVRRGEPRGQRLDLVNTLRAAAPWQAVRRAQRAAAAAPGAAAAPRIEVRPDDFHVPRLRHRTQTTTVFAIDASGSAALHRLAEAKGAVELLLADCYVRRDRVAVLAFRGAGAELLLPPTRSLVRAKRSLAGLPGGGGTPLASGLQAAAAVAEGARRRGETPLLVLLTDGRANIARDGSPGRTQAEADALAVARDCRAQGLRVLVVDTSPQPAPAARRLAEALGGRYLALPHAGAQALSAAVQAVGRPGR